jgi:hypothetical protein
MLLSAFSIPTARAARGLQIVQALFAVMAGDFDTITASTLDELRSAWANITHQHVLYHSELPSEEVVSFFRQAKAPMLVFVDDPVAIAAALEAERAIDCVQAIRYASIHASVLEGVWVSPEVLLINAGAGGALSLRAFVESLTAHLSLPCADEQVSQIVGRLAHLTGSSVSADSPWMAIESNPEVQAALRVPSGEEPTMAERHLASYRVLSAQQPINSVVWPADVFTSVDHAGAPLSGMIDMTGRQRLLIDGPWLGLPSGRWQANVDFEVADNLMGCLMYISVYSEGVLRQGRVTLPESGLHACSLAFDHPDARIPVVMQFTLDRGVLQGGFRLLQVQLQRMSGAIERQRRLLISGNDNYK